MGSGSKLFTTGLAGADVSGATEADALRSLKSQLEQQRALNQLAMSLHALSAESEVYDKVTAVVCSGLAVTGCRIYSIPSPLRPGSTLQSHAVQSNPPPSSDQPGSDQPGSDISLQLAAAGGHTPSQSEPSIQMLARRCVQAGQQMQWTEADSSPGSPALAVPVMTADGTLFAVLACEHTDAAALSSTAPLLQQVSALLAAKLAQLADFLQLQQSVVQLEYAGRLQRVLFNIASLQYDGERPQLFYQQLHDNVASLIYAENFFIALFDQEQEVLHFPYFADSKEHISPDQFYPKEILERSLTGYVFRTDRPLLADKAQLAQLDQDQVVKAYGEQPEYWLGVPFKSEDKVQGVVVVQSYDPARNYQQTDLDLLLFVSQHICSALERALVHQRLMHQALHDALTRLPNRILFLDRVRQAFKRRRRYPDHVVAVAYLDLDRFKMVNDTLGHQVGDDFLVGVAQLLKSCLRQNDTLARLGGDEFAILLEDVYTEADVAEVMVRIGHKLQQPVHVRQHKLQTSASIGVALADAQTELDDTDELIRRADIAMYQAKQDGRGVYRFFSTEMDQRAVRHYQLEMEIQAALEQQQFVLHYQPVVELATDTTVGFEALIRWMHPQRGFIAPNDFIPLAEELGLLGVIDLYVVGQAIAQLRQWRQDYATSFYVSVNISGRSFSREDFADQVLQQLEEAGLPASYLAIEITERALIDKIEQARLTISRLRDAGVRVFLDDFGTGYSSLSYLHEFQLDVLKIDRSFIAGIRPRIQENAVVNTIIALARTLDLKVIAEGVENSLQRKLLLDLGCDCGQGYWFAAALPAKQAAEWLR